MSISLPKEFSYDVLESLPSGITNQEIMLLPINGSAFSCANSGTVMQWTLPSVGFLQPDSFYLKYNFAVTSLGESQILGCPFFAPLQRMQTLFGSQIVENVNNYNAVNHMLSNVNLDVSQKWGLQQTFGYNNSSAAAYQVSNLQSMNGAVLAQNITGGWSGFLPSILSNSQKLVPLSCMPSVTVQITQLDSVANIFAPAAAVVAANAVTGVLAQAACVLPTDFILSNVTLCYNCLTLPESLSSMLLKEDKIFIKSNSFMNIQNFIPVGSSGQLELVYNTRLASVKTCFLLNSSNSTNKIFDSFDVTTAGDYIFSVAGKLFPARPITYNDILSQLRKSVGAIGCKNTTFSIDTAEMLYVASGVIQTTRETPSKFYPSINLSTVPFSDVLLSGISTQSSPISVRMNIILPTTRTITQSLVMYYDAIIEIDTVSKNATVKQ